MAGKRLRIAGVIMLVGVGLMTLGIIQGMVLQHDVIATETSSPDPATAIAIISTIGLLFCAGVVISVVLILRGSANQRKRQ